MDKKKKMGYSARMKKPGIIEIDYSGKKLSLGKGDEVIVVQTTGIPVRNRLTGKILGNRESIIGRGVIDVKTADALEIRIFSNAENRQMNMTNAITNVIVKKVHSD